jgi:hypothetical protein
LLPRLAITLRRFTFECTNEFYHRFGSVSSRWRLGCFIFLLSARGWKRVTLEDTLCVLDDTEALWF